MKKLLGKALDFFCNVQTTCYQSDRHSGGKSLTQRGRDLSKHRYYASGGCSRLFRSFRRKSLANGIFADSYWLQELDKVVRSSSF